MRIGGWFASKKARLRHGLGRWVARWQSKAMTLCASECRGAPGRLVCRNARDVFSSCICWQGQRVARTLESLSSTFLLHLCMLEQMCFQVVQQLNNLGLISMNKLSTLENMCHEEFSTNWQEWCVTHSPLKKMQSFRIARALSRVIGTRNTQRWENCRFSMMETMNNWSMIFTALRTERLISRQPFWGKVLRCRCRDNDMKPTTMTCWVMWRLSGRQCGDDTHKSRSLIKFLHEWYLSRLSLFVRWRMPSASLRCCFSLFARHAWCSESVRVDCCAWCAVLVHETHLSAVFKARLSLLSGSSLLSLMYRHIWILTGQIVSKCSEVWQALWIGRSEILLHSSRVRESLWITLHLHAWSLYSIITSIIYICWYI